MSPIDLSVITISTNEAHWLPACLDALREHRGDLRMEVILIDNASTDGTGDLVREQYPEVRLLRQEVKTGFASNNNWGIANARGRHILLLNPDTRVHRGTLPGLVASMDEHQDVGIAGAKLLNPNGTVQLTCRRFPGPMAVASRWGERYLPGWTQRWQDHYLMREFDHENDLDVDWILGAFLLIRRRALAATGLLDIGFDPLYYEDVDLCARMWRQGYRVVYRPDFTITHHYHRESAASLFNRMTYFHIRNVFRFWWKHRQAARRERRYAHGPGPAPR